jgi:hypothetical protein
MTAPRQPWDSLVAAARRAPAEPDAAAPYGFATRVVACAFAVPEPTAEVLLERFALRGLFVAATFSVATAVFSYSALTGAAEEEAAAGDTVIETLAQS